MARDVINGALPELSAFGRQAREQINQAGRFLQERGVLSPGLSFNAGIRVPGQDRFILGGFTPAGQPLAPAALVDFDGTCYEGRLKPNHLELIEVYATLFRHRLGIGAAIHTHSPQLESFAIAHRALPICFGQNLARLVTHEIPVTPWQPRYSAEPIQRTLDEHPQTPAILIANHGPFVWGAEINEVACLIVELEEAAEVTLKAQLLGGAVPFNGAVTGLPQVLTGNEVEVEHALAQ